MKTKQKILKKYDATNHKDWLECPFVDNTIKEQIRKMTKTELEVAFSNEQLGFGTAGIRAIIGPGTQQLNKFVYHQMSIGYGQYLFSKNPQPAIVIGHDNRKYSKEFAQECAEILSQVGVKVYLYSDNKLISTPIISYTIRELELDGAINITASHNPKEYNGFKAYNATGSQILPEEADIIIKHMPDSKDILNIKQDIANEKNNSIIDIIDYDEIIENYFNDIINETIYDTTFNEPQNKIKTTPIVFTGFQGTTTKLMPRFLKQLGMKKVIEVPGQNIISSEFEASQIANPEDDRAFEKAKEVAKKNNAKIIFGCDPDGDRMTIGFLKKNGKWRFLNGNEQGIIFTWYLLRNRQYQRKPFIISSLVSTTYIDKIAARYNAEVYRTPTGFKWMCNLIDKLEQEGDFVLAFEEAIGALVHPVCRDKDSYGAIALMLEIMHNTGYEDLHQLLEKVIYKEFEPSYSITKSFVIDSENWKKDAENLIQFAKKQKTSINIDLYEIDNVWYDKKGSAVVWDLNKDSWIKFRVSGTEPKFKVYFCLFGQNVKNLSKSVENIMKFINLNILKDIKIKK